jgi:hypothetical protein
LIRREALTAANPLLTVDGATLLSSFGMNALVANRYVESDGESVYVEGEKSLRITPDGQLLFNIWMAVRIQTSV